MGSGSQQKEEEFRKGQGNMPAIWGSVRILVTLGGSECFTGTLQLIVIAGKSVVWFIKLKLSALNQESEFESHLLLMR